jgi:UDP-glucuronate 4-epimerase
MSKTLVTGAAGFIGSHVAERLLDLGTAVVGLDGYDDFYDPAVKRANLIRARDYESFLDFHGDIRDRDALDRLPHDIDTVVHLAARAGVRPSIDDPCLYSSVNVQGTVTLLDWARVRRIRHVVFGSSSSVYGNASKVPFSEDDPVDRPISPYAATKRAGEILCHTFHHINAIGIVALRFFTVYGPRQRPDLAIHKFAKLLAEGRPIPMFGDGSTARDYTYIDDIVDGVMRAVELVHRDPEVFEIINLGGSRTLSLAQMIQLLAERMDRHPTVQSLPLQPGDVTRTWADVRKARLLLGYRPTTSFEVGLDRFLEWFLQHAQIGASRIPTG